MSATRPTIRDVARLADVSIGTASRVVNGDARVLPANRRRVEEAIAALNYRPNTIARSLVSHSQGRPRESHIPPDRPRLVTFGYLNVDQFIQLPTWPERAGRMTAEKMVKAIGGPAANVAIAAARLRGEYELAVDLLSVVGQDANSDWALDTLIRYGVSVDYVSRETDGHLSQCVILVEPNGQRTIINEPLVWSLPGVEHSLVDLVGRDRPVCLHLEGFRAELLEKLPLPIARRLWMLTMDATGLPSHWRTWPRLRFLVDRVDILFLSKQATADILGIAVNDPSLCERFAERMRSLETPPKAAVVVTLGSSGSVMFDGGDVIHAPALEVHAVDTTGAGDVFVGIFLAIHLSTGDKREALRKAAIGASLSVTKLGANTVEITSELLSSLSP